MAMVITMVTVSMVVVYSPGSGAGGSSRAAPFCAGGVDDVTSVVLVAGFRFGIGRARGGSSGWDDGSVWGSL